MDRAGGLDAEHPAEAGCCCYPWLVDIGQRLYASVKRPGLLTMPGNSV